MVTILPRRSQPIVRLVTIIVAKSRNNAIGNNNDLPWDLPADRKNFRKKTMGKTVVVGRITEESIEKRLGTSLPGRKTIVLTANKDYKPFRGCQVINDFRRALALARHEEVFVIGGKSVYEVFFPHATRMIVTEVDAEIEGDTFFPEFDMSEWHEKSRVHYPADGKNKYSFSIVEYVR